MFMEWLLLEQVRRALVMIVVVVFGVDDISSFHTDKIAKPVVLNLGEGDIFGIDGSFGAPEKKFRINLSKTNIKFCFCNIVVIIVISLSMEKKSISLKLILKL